MPNQRDIARLTGLSQGTVSLALRDSPLIAEKTKEEVHLAAQKLGYAPNPMVNALMAHVRQSGPIKSEGCLAVLVDFASKEEWFGFHEAYREQYDAIVKRAALRGYRTECFFLRAPKMSSEQIDRILYNRGIPGIILASPRKDELGPLKFNWERYAWIKSGYAWPNVPIDSVTANYRQHVELTFHSLRNAGFHRIGYCIHESMLERANCNWLVGHIIAQRRLPETERIPLFISNEGPNHRKKFHQWLEKQKPEIIVGGQLECEWLNSLKQHTFKPKFHTRYYRRWLPKSAGVKENEQAIGESLADLLIEQIIHNKRGLPELPRQTVISGSWISHS